MSYLTKEHGTPQNLLLDILAKYDKDLGSMELAQHIHLPPEFDYVTTDYLIELLRLLNKKHRNGHSVQDVQ